MLGVAHRMDALAPSRDKFILKDRYGQGCFITLNLLRFGENGTWKSGGWAPHVRDRLTSETDSSIPKCSMLPTDCAIYQYRTFSPPANLLSKLGLLHNQSLLSLRIAFHFC